MNNERPELKEYVVARLVAMASFLFVSFVIILEIFLPEDDKAVILASGLLAFALIAFVFAIARGAKRMEKELRTINAYLKNLEEIESIDYKTHFFTQEFDEMNQNLIKVLKKSKKREDTKQRYNAKLKLKNRQRADMLSAISHEFRNPIASIMGYSQTLVDDTDIPKPLRDKFLEKIYNNGNKIEVLLSRLMMWNKFESKEANVHKTTFDIYTLIHEIKITLEEQYKDRTIIITGEPREVEADRALIEVVLKNLIENALKYSKEEVTVQLDQEKVSVIDKGIGIKDKELDKVTKKFYRAGQHSWDNSMGLGLSIVKTILTLHGSKLEIESELEVGSTFSFKI